LDLDATDNEILLLVTKGCTSAYSVWTTMKKEAKDGNNNNNRKVMTYRNTNKRVLRLAKVGLLEEIKSNPHTVNIHGRKDYKVSMTGLSCLMPRIMTQSADANSIISYMERFGLDKRAFGDLLISQVASRIDSATQHLESIKTIYTVNRYIFDFASSPMISHTQMRPIQKSYDGFKEMLEDMYDAFDLKLKPTLYVSKQHDQQQQQHQQQSSRSSKNKKTLLPSTASRSQKKKH
jgi:hypothetical protein